MTAAQWVTLVVAVLGVLHGPLVQQWLASRKAKRTGK